MLTSPLKTFDLEDGHLAYADEGPPDAQLAVLLHGGAVDHRMWDPQVGALVDAGFRVVRPDFRGHGRSSTPRRPFCPTTDTAALLRGLAAGPAVVIGLSMGAGVATQLALAHPGLVSRAVISGAGTGAPDFRDPWTLGVLAEWQRAERELDLEGWLDAFVRLGAGPHRGVHDVDPAVVAYLRETARATVVTHVSGDSARATPPRGTASPLGETAVPFRAILGALDSEDHLRMAREVIDAVPDGELAVIEGTAHYPNLEDPDAFNREMLRMLGVH